jgi:acyl carrier protein
MHAIDERFGALHGVLHAAAVTSGLSISHPLTQIGREESETQFRPKAHGTYVLETVLGERELDFCLLFSSNASVLGGMGFAAYSAANHFLDAFASDRSRMSPFPWISATWDGWLTTEPSGERTVRSSMEEYAMTPSESVEAFRRVVTMSTVDHVVVSRGDLPARLAIWIRRESLERATPKDEAGGSYSRPALGTAYVAPRSETEQAVAEIWQTLLGLTEVGLYDNFFELGGHSLLGTQLVSRIRETFGVELSLRSLFEGPTIEQLARAVETAKRGQTPDRALTIIPRSREAYRSTRASLVAGDRSSKRSAHA